MVLARVRAGLVGLVLMLCASTASAQQTTPTLTGSANGLNVSLSWTAIAGATGYDLLVTYNSTGPFTIAVGAITSFSIDAPPGAYQMAVRATAAGLAGPLSNPIALTVSATPPAAPAAPANLAAAIVGNSVLLTWDLATTNGLLGLALQAGSSPGASDLGTHAIRVSTSAFLGSVPNGNYFMRLLAVGAGGLSPASNELNLAVPSCTALPSIPLTSTGQGNVVQLSWPQVPGATAYRLDFSTAPGGSALASQPFPATETSFQIYGAPQGTYFAKLVAQTACGESTSPEVQLVVTAPVRLPAKSMGEAANMVVAAGASTPGIHTSCGNHTWLFRVLQKLRTQDNRFGLNWKRGVPGSVSDDVIVYNFSELPDEQARAPQMYAWDVIFGHCGSSPRAGANGSITNPRGQAAWTIQPYLQAGYVP